MAEWDIIIDVVLTMLITVVFTVFGVQFGRKIERQAYRQMESNYQVELTERKSLDSREEKIARVTQAERRRVYEAILTASRRAIATVALRRGPFLIPRSQIDLLTELQKMGERLQNLQPKIDLIASPEVIGLSTDLYEVLGRCWYKLYDAIGQWDFQEGSPDSASEPERNLQIDLGVWEEAQRMIHKEFDCAENLFLELRDQIRKELGYEEIYPESAPTLDELRSELAKNDLN